jgi:hypothetical protein
MCIGKNLHKTHNVTNEPVITVRKGRKRAHAHEVQMSGNVVINYSPHKSLDCGDRVWIKAEHVLLSHQEFNTITNVIKKSTKAKTK